MIKDWKKVKPHWIVPKELMRWEHKERTNYHVGISKFLHGDFFVSMTLDQYLGGFDKSRTFKTKTQALKYAKAYMRKH